MMITKHNSMSLISHHIKTKWTLKRHLEEAKQEEDKVLKNYFR